MGTFEGRRRRLIRGLGWGLLGAAVALMVALALWKIPAWLHLSQGLSPSERISVENEVIRTLAHILTAAFLLLGFYLTWRRIGAAERAADANLKAARAAEDGQRTADFARGIENLAGSESATLRLGAIYSLEQIARQSGNHHWPILEILTSHIRGIAPWRQSLSGKAGDEPDTEHVAAEELPPTGGGKATQAGRGISAQLAPPGVRPTQDVQAILEVIGRRQSTLGTDADRQLNLRRAVLRGASLARTERNDANYQRLDCSHSDLREAQLHAADLRETVFEHTDLRYAKLRCANLAGVNLNGADVQDAEFHDAQGLTPEAMKLASNWVLAKYDSRFAVRCGLPPDHEARIESRELRGINLRDVSLHNPDLAQVDLQDADLRGARLEGASLYRANLRGADLRGADLYGVSLNLARLNGTDLRSSSLGEADLSMADLDGARLEEATGIEREQVTKARNWLFAHYSEEMTVELGLPADHRAKVRERDLSGCELQNLELGQTDFSGANLVGVDFTGADLEGAVFDRARMTDVILRGAHLHSADLSDARGLSQDQLNSANGDENTGIPDDLTMPGRWRLDDGDFEDREEGGPE